MALDGVDAVVVEAEVELAVLVPPLAGGGDQEALGGNSGNLYFASENAPESSPEFRTITIQEVCAYWQHLIFIFGC